MMRKRARVRCIIGFTHRTPEFAGVYRRLDAGTVPPARLELPAALVLKDLPHLVHDNHGLWHLVTDLSLHISEVGRVAADQRSSERPGQFETAAEKQSADG